MVAGEGFVPPGFAPGVGLIAGYGVVGFFELGEEPVGEVALEGGVVGLVGGAGGFQRAGLEVEEFDRGDDVVLRGVGNVHADEPAGSGRRSFGLSGKVVCYK